jgi:predicted transposase YbfD/YdcC
MPRPKLQNKEKRTRKVNVAFNEIEYEKISVLAKICKRKIATYIREVSLDGNNVKFVPSINKETCETILEMQWSLNRLSGSLNKENLTNSDIATLRGIQNKLRQIHREFLGNGIN